MTRDGHAKVRVVGMTELDVASGLVVDAKSRAQERAEHRHGFACRNPRHMSSRDHRHAFLEQRTFRRDAFAALDEGAEVATNGIARHCPRFIKCSAGAHETGEHRHDDLESFTRNRLVDDRVRVLS